MATRPRKRPPTRTPLDDEPVTAAELRAIKRSIRELARGEYIILGDSRVDLAGDDPQGRSTRRKALA